jgi:hypothetical protein
MNVSVNRKKAAKRSDASSKSLLENISRARGRICFIVISLKMYKSWLEKRAMHACDLFSKKEN